MNCYAQTLLSALFAATLLHSPWVSAGDQPSGNYSEPEIVPLSEEDLRAITAQIMARQPLLSSSPGIKFAEAIRTRGTEDWAVIIYYPHTESAGIKEAFQVDCTRLGPGTAWACEDADIRRYLALATQDYEVRVTGPISSTAAVALIESTRKLLPVRTAGIDDVPDTAMILSSHDDSASVTWVNFEGSSYQRVRGRLTESGDPTRPQDWIVDLL